MLFEYGEGLSSCKGMCYVVITVHCLGVGFWEV